VEGLNSETQYYFAVKAVDDATNWSPISNAASAITADITPPGPIVDLEVVDYSETTATLTWTAPGDNDYVGTPTAYDLRWSTGPITDANWDAAVVVSGVTTPGPSGTTETWLVSGLPAAGTYYFAIKTSDEVENLSELSNVATLAMQIVVFPDPWLDQEIRRIIEKSVGTIVAPDLEPVDSINVVDAYLENISGLEYCTNLRYLRISWNWITDISPIADLILLEHLEISDLPINDLNAIAGLVNLNYLDISYHETVPSFDPVLNLTGLDTLIIDNDSLADLSIVNSLPYLNYLSAAWNQITDITPVSGLDSLEYLNISYNDIVDISPLQPVRTIDTIYMAGNQVSDLLPLVNNIGLGAGDFVDVTGNPLSGISWESYIPQLEARQVTVWYGGR
jgi:hypothetical protein